MSGVVYVAYGFNAGREVKESLASLEKHNKLPTLVVDESVFREPGPGARWAKLNVDKLIPWGAALYLDADTRVHADVSVGFDLLEAGFDLVLVPSINQGSDLFRHIGQEERKATYQELGNPFPLQLQAGVFWFHKERCARLFETWREEWQRFKGQDQAALLRALNREPVRVWLLGREFNDRQGSVIEHRFGRAR